MIETVGKLLPILLTFIVACLVRHFGVLRAKDGERLLKLVFFVTIPPLVFVSAARVTLVGELLVFPLVPLIMVPISFVLARAVSPLLRLPSRRAGVFEAAPMITNAGFVLPFLMALFGSEGVTRSVLFNVTNHPLIFVWGYAVVAAHNRRNHGSGVIIEKMFMSPAVWALLLGLLCNFTNTVLPAPLETGLSTIGNATGVLIIIALGLLFQPGRAYAGSALLVVAMRSGLGLVVGLLLTAILNLQGVDRTALLLLASGPVGFSLLTFVSLEKLDQDYAARIESYSLVASLMLASGIVALTT